MKISHGVVDKINGNVVCKYPY